MFDWIKHAVSSGWHHAVHWVVAAGLAIGGFLHLYHEPAPRLADAVLPDLVTLAPSDLSIEYETIGGHKVKELRLSNTVRNVGNGPLHMLGLKPGDPKPWEKDHLPVIAAPVDPTLAPPPHDDGTDDGNMSGRIDVNFKGYQVLEAPVYENGKFVKWQPRAYYGPVGNMFFHREHNHIHFNEFARYLILNANTMAPQPGIHPGRKVSFCIEDFNEWNHGAVFGRPDGPRFSCGMEQGISPGYEDTYGSFIEGQYVDVTSLPDGKYYLYTAATRVFKETDTSNNDSATLFEIKGDHVKVLETLDSAKLEARAKAIQEQLGLQYPLLPPPNPNPQPQSFAPAATQQAPTAQRSAPAETRSPESQPSRTRGIARSF